MDYNKPIPEIPFPAGLIMVSNPSLEPFVYLDDEFECDSAYNLITGQRRMGWLFPAAVRVSWQGKP